jgi:hypothetical protein
MIAIVVKLVETVFLVIHTTLDKILYQRVDGIVLFILVLLFPATNRVGRKCSGDGGPPPDIFYLESHLPVHALGIILTRGLFPSLKPCAGIEERYERHCPGIHPPRIRLTPLFP